MNLFYILYISFFIIQKKFVKGFVILSNKHQNSQFSYSQPTNCGIINYLKFFFILFIIFCLFK